LLDDVGAAFLRVDGGGWSLRGTMLPMRRERLGSGVYHMEINADLMRLAHGGLTVVDLDVRRRLVRKPMAQWLQLYTGWLATEGRRAVELGEVCRVSRSAMEPRRVRFYARKALDELAAAGAPPWQFRAGDVLCAV
jgi:hypothetical protein